MSTPPASRLRASAPSRTTPWVVGLGGNLGDSRRIFQQALHQLAKVASVRGVSRLYRSRPQGGPVQADYFNAAALVVTSLSPEALLDSLLGIERLHGRQRREPLGPRTLDLDLLWSTPRLELRTSRLTVPHPRLRLRLFALLPLLDLCPEARAPEDGATYGAIMEALPDQGVVVLEDFGWCGTPGSGTSPSE